MRFKLLSVFLAIQLFSFTLWTTVFSDNSLTEKNTRALPPVQNSEETFAPSALDLASAAITETPDQNQTEQAIPVLSEEIVPPAENNEEVYVPHFAAANMSDEQGVTNPIQQNQLQQALVQLPLAHAKTLETITLDYDAQAHRGLGGAGVILLRAVDMTTEEFIAVFIHELGHNVDYGFLSPSETSQESSFKDGDMPLYETDPSLDFYRLSWYTNDQKRTEMTEFDFVSGYAMSDPFEDFAETYAFYVLHNETFKALTSSSTVLQAKYNFMKDVVFSGEEFDLGPDGLNLQQRPWDVTVLPYDLEKFLEASSSSSEGGGQN